VRSAIEKSPVARQYWSLNPFEQCQRTEYDRVNVVDERFRQLDRYDVDEI